MSSRAFLGVVLLLSGLLTLVDSAQAWPLRRARTNTYSSGSTRVAPKADEESSEYPVLRVFYSYEQALRQDVAFKDRVRVFLDVRDEAVLNLDQPLVAEVKITDLSNSELSAVKWCPVSLGSAVQKEEQVGVFEVANEGSETLLRPAKVYRMWVNLHRKADAYGKDTVVGRVRGPYYVATSGSTLLERGRRQIAMRTFREWYYTERGWDSGENYPMDCHAYYLWATGTHTVGASSGRANLGRLFSGRTPYRGGSDIDDIAKDEPIHGDYVRIPGHTFMLLAYDVKQGRVWTMEGNFGRSIEIAIRSVGSGWTVGHLAEEHIRAEALAAAPEAGPSGETLVHVSDSNQAATIP